MASIHVIYDPRGRFQLAGDAMVQALCSFATLNVADELTDEQIKEIARQLAEMVLNASAPAPKGDQLDFSTGTPEPPDTLLPIKEGHPIWEAIDRGGGQACDIPGVILELSKAGYVIVPART